MEAKQRSRLKICKKCCLTILLAAGLLLSAAGGAKAVDFQAKGGWLMGFGVNGGLGENSFINKVRNNGGSKTKANTQDTFAAAQRIRLQLDAVASEALSGTVFFEIGDTTWGQNATGGALGADRTSVIELKNAYLDWQIPKTQLRTRMGIQGIALPNTAGGSAIMDADSAGIVASYQFNDNVGLTALWMRPVNGNFVGWTDGADRAQGNNYLDNIDLIALTLPLKVDCVEFTPWVMYGMMGKNVLEGYGDGSYPSRYANANPSSWSTVDGNLAFTLNSLYPGFNAPNGLGSTSKAYGSMFFAGLPLAVAVWDPLNIEIDLNYGYVEAMGRYDVARYGDVADIMRASTRRQGWLAKALIEYKTDWGTPGIFGWYASGDDGDVKNGSERLPTIAGAANFTSFMGDGNLGWVPGAWYDLDLSYAGTWGLGMQLKNMSFVENLIHTFRIAYWNGTNSPSLVKYMSGATAWTQGTGAQDGPYLTTNDGLLEFNLVNSMTIYENLEANLELGYIANMVDDGTWKRSWTGDSYEKQDAWKAQLVFAYRF
ncbi:hypothetical protein AGMMS49925_11780 [Deltaproteobacteria bacterium]|nr:hypothetical protein AGMMS49925_11780 [Deltaproteobacteria bacterium]